MIKNILIWIGIAFLFYQLEVFMFFIAFSVFRESKYLSFLFLAVIHFFIIRKIVFILIFPFSNIFLSRFIIKSTFNEVLRNYIKECDYIHSNYKNTNDPTLQLYYKRIHFLTLLAEFQAFSIIKDSLNQIIEIRKTNISFENEDDLCKSFLYHLKIITVCLKSNLILKNTFKFWYNDILAYFKKCLEIYYPERVQYHEVGNIEYCIINAKHNKNNSVMMLCNPNGICYEMYGIFPEFLNLYLKSSNISVVLWNYQGYGKRKGSPRFQNMQNDATIILKHIIENFKFKKIGIHGTSIGGSIASLVGSKFSGQINLIIADRTFSKLENIISEYIFGKYLSFLYRLVHFDSLTDNVDSYLKCTTNKVLLSDYKDEIIPFRSSLKEELTLKLLKILQEDIDIDLSKVFSIEDIKNIKNAINNVITIDDWGIENTFIINFVKSFFFDNGFEININNFEVNFDLYFEVIN
jgi:hypothetical protein